MSQEFHRHRTEAKELYTSLWVHDRADGGTYIKLKDDAPEWMRNCCLEAHRIGPTGSLMLPDDHRYQFIAQAAEILANESDWDDVQEFPEADAYDGELTSWLDSHWSRKDYVDQARGEYGDDGDLVTLLTRGQVEEKLEVLHAVADFIKEMIEEQDEEEEAAS